MGEVNSFRDLRVWQEGMDLVTTCYRVSQGWPKEERFGLTDQLRRAAVSVPANIAEGHGRAATGDYLHHLSIAMGSLAELETHLLIARRLDYLTEEQVAPLLVDTDRLGKMLRVLMQRLRAKRA